MNLSIDKLIQIHPGLFPEHPPHFEHNARRDYKPVCYAFYRSPETSIFDGFFLLIARSHYFPSKLVIICCSVRFVFMSFRYNHHFISCTDHVNSGIIVPLS